MLAKNNSVKKILFGKSSLIVILIIASLFRFYEVNWDDYFHFHPDERMIAMVSERIRLPGNAGDFFKTDNPLNPNFFAYGSFPIYLLKFTGSIFSLVDSQFSSYPKINLIGRVISGFSDLGIIITIYLIGKRIWNKRVGIYASLFYTFSVFPIQAAHFFAVDTLLSFFVITTLYRLIVLYEKPSITNASFVGVFFGLALATKISATVLLVTIGVTLIVELLLIFLKRFRQIFVFKKIHKEFLSFIIWIFSSLKTPKRQRLIAVLILIIKLGMAIAIFTLITFAIFEPYALIDFKNFIRQTTEQHQMTKSAYTFPYTLQYVGTTPYIYHLKNLVVWGMEIPLGVLSVTATVWLILRLIKEVPKPGRENQEAKILITMSFFVIYFMVVGRFAIKFMRYFLPLYGIFCLFSGLFIDKLIHRRRAVVRIIGLTILFTVLVTSVFWSLAFVKIYSKRQTRISATEWINEHIPDGAKIAIEHWDDRVPLYGNYEFLEMPMYDPDDSEIKWAKVNQNLEKADYIVIASNRLYTPLTKLADCNKYEKCYPKTSVYYNKLFTGQLGFSKIAEFTSYPTIPFLNIEINDDLADESFTVYDHPKIMIFKKVTSHQ